MKIKEKLFWKFCENLVNKVKREQDDLKSWWFDV